MPQLRMPVVAARRALAAAAAGVVLAVALVGCGGTAPGGGSPGGDDPGGEGTTPAAPSGAPSSEPAPSAAGTSPFPERIPLPACDPVVLAQGEVVPPEAWDCLNDAAAATGAELAVTTPTVEGDPITSYYRVGPGIEGLEVYVDGTKDRFGDPQHPWTYTSCPQTVDASEPAGCVS